jgi:glutaredoxin
LTRCFVIKAWPENVVSVSFLKNGTFMRTAKVKSGSSRYLFSLATLVVFSAGVLYAGATHAQVYRIVGADGKVTFSDTPPPASGNKKASATGTAGSSSSGGAAIASLPFELRQVATKYPVTIYTGDNCGPCVSGRSMLTSRGVPFAEKTVTTSEDAQALQRISSEASLPILTIGSQQLKGFSDAEWTQFLDAAGFPKSSTLPSGYRQAAATPLVTVAPVAAAVPAAARAPVSPAAVAAPAPTPVASPKTNPAGIRF